MASRAISPPETVDQCIRSSLHTNPQNTHTMVTDLTQIGMCWRWSYHLVCFLWNGLGIQVGIGSSAFRSPGNGMARSLAYQVGCQAQVQVAAKPPTGWLLKASHWYVKPVQHRSYSWVRNQPAGIQCLQQTSPTAHTSHAQQHTHKLCKVWLAYTCVLA